MDNELASITTSRFLLRRIVRSDIQNIYNGLSNPLVIKHYGVSYDSLEAAKQQMTWYESPRQCWWAICSIADGTFYGAGGLNDLSPEHQKAELGLWLLPEFWGKGIMKEVVPSICDYGFEELALHRIEGFIDADNQNCKRAMAKLDFQYEGTMRDCEMKNGQYVSVDIYAKLNNHV